MRPISNFLFSLLLSASAFASEEIIKKKYFTLNYNEEHEVANWVSYELDHARLQNCAKRTDNFRPDPQVSTGSAIDNDYRGSGFDRGHLVPAGDMKFRKEAMSETFFFSNMTPQPANFNRGKWAQLENLMRAWGSRYSKIWIVTGPILRDDLPAIGKQNKVSVPTDYFKVVVRQSGATYEGIAFIMNTEVPSPDLKSYVVTINEVEEATGFDFFTFVNESVEQKSDLFKWDFSGKFEYFPCRASVTQ
jgi:endonuclease G, mitochondrial